MLRSRRAGVLVAIVTAIASLATASVAGARTVHLRGIAYEFNNTGVRLQGAQIRVAEDPRLGAVTKRDGSYDLAVPDRTAVTPYISAAGYHTIFLQTFRTRGEDLERVNFQTPTDGTYRALAALLAVPLDANGGLRDCAIVSTFSTRNVRDVSFDEFTAYGAHGIAGATAFATPALAPPTYFNEQVVPDPAQESSSDDGGVIWTEVPAGVYTIRARHSSTSFAPFVATCAPGRVVNANPPWGLHELGKAMPALVTARWFAGATAVRLRGLRVANLPRDATAQLRCRGRDCPFTVLTFRRRAGGSINLFRRLGSRARRIGAGQTLDLTLTAHAYDGTFVHWRLARGRAPGAVTRCVPLGNTKPQRRCPG